MNWPKHATNAGNVPLSLPLGLLVSKAEEELI